MQIGKCLQRAQFFFLNFLGSDKHPPLQFSPRIWVVYREVPLNYDSALSPSQDSGFVSTLSGCLSASLVLTTFPDMLASVVLAT